MRRACLGVPLHSCSTKGLVNCAVYLCFHVLGSLCTCWLEALLCMRWSEAGSILLCEALLAVCDTAQLSDGHGVHVRVCDTAETFCFEPITATQLALLVM